MFGRPFSQATPFEQAAAAHCAELHLASLELGLHLDDGAGLDGLRGNRAATTQGSIIAWQPGLIACMLSLELRAVIAWVAASAAALHLV